MLGDSLSLRTKFDATFHGTTWVISAARMKNDLRSFLIRHGCRVVGRVRHRNIIFIAELMDGGNVGISPRGVVPDLHRSENYFTCWLRVPRLRRLLGGLLLFGLSLVFSGCKQKAPAVPAPDYRPAATIKDLMDSIVDPSADYLWNSVSTISTKNGVLVMEPKTEVDWTEEDHRVIALIEATNLLQVPGRMVAHPGEKAKNPAIEETPEQIQAHIDADRKSWINFAHGLYDAVSVMKRAIDARSVKGISSASEGVDQACEHCHKNYWYPHEYDKFPKSDGTSGEKIVNPVPKSGIPDL